MFSDVLLNLSRQLYPRGRAFRMPVGGFLESLHIALGKSEARFKADASSFLDSLLPDNANFTVDDANDWERRFGLITNGLTSLDDRKAAIIRKMQYPGKNPAKSHYLYIQQQLQLAGFNVFVYENLPTQQSPVDFLPPGPFSSYVTYAQLGAYELGDVELGEYKWNNTVINNLNEEDDLNFNTGANLKATIFISGNPKGTFVNIPASRKDEFRQLILKLKNSHIVVFLYINYI